MGAGININTWQPGESGYVTFQVKVDACPDFGTFDLKNVAKVRADNVAQKEDFALIKLTVVRPPEPPVLEITKKVANLTKGETEYVDANLAFPGDVLQYKIAFANTGEQTATNVRLLDQLPGDVEFMSGSAMLYLNGSVTALSDAIISQGVGVPNLAPQMAGYLTLKVKAKDNLDAGLVLIDTAHIYADCNLHAQAQAKTTIHLPVKPKPPVVAPKLPSTGSSFALLFAIMVASIATLYTYYNKEKKSALNALRNSRTIK
jgi:uncharacterized repeat protein (TIGR01451 family)